MLVTTLVGLKITAGQRTKYGRDDHWSGQTFGLPVILYISDQKKVHFYPITFLKNKIEG